MINNLFPTPVYYSSIDEEILKRLQKDITEYVKNNGDLFKTAVWKCNTETNIFCEEKKAFFTEYLKDTIFKHTSEYLVECGFKPRPFYVEDCWITLGGDGAYQELHDHLGAGNTSNGFSSVLYISIDKNKGGELSLIHI